MCIDSGDWYGGRATSRLCRFSYLQDGANTPAAENLAALLIHMGGMGATGTILLVDDSPNDLELLTRTLGQLGVENPIETCSSADDALHYLERHELPAVMLLDLKMPGHDGFYVLRRIKGSPVWKDLVVIVLTTSADLHDIRQAYEMGANSFLTKPVNLTEFKDMISAFHKYWIVHAQQAPPLPRVLPKDQTAA